MANKTVKLGGSDAFQDIGTIGQTTEQLSGNMKSVDQILDVGLRNTRNYMDGFVRVSDLVALGYASLSGNVLTATPTIRDTTTVAFLPADVGVGTRSFVTDATSTTFLSTVAGGGSNRVPVVFDGQEWVIG